MGGYLGLDWIGLLHACIWSMKEAYRLLFLVVRKQGGEGDISSLQRSIRFVVFFFALAKNGGRGGGPSCWFESDEY